MRDAVIISFGWVAFWLVWIVAAFTANRPLQTPASMKKFIGIRMGVIALAAVLALVVDALPASVRNAWPLAHGAAAVIFLIIFLLGLGLAFWARVCLGREWGMPMTQKIDMHLVTSGPYRLIRHPIYTGMLLMTLASALLVNIYWIEVFIVATIYFSYSARAEEKTLATSFPALYPEYQKHTKMLVPFVI